MAKRPLMSRGELDVARSVWELEEATVGEVYEHLSARKSIDYTTVQTYLRRLEQKGYLRTRRAGRQKIYQAKLSPGRATREVIDDLLNRLFDGEALPLMQHLIREHGISTAETNQLRRMLDQLEAETDNDERDSDESQ